MSEKDNRQAGYECREPEHEESREKALSGKVITFEEREDERRKLLENIEQERWRAWREKHPYRAFALDYFPTFYSAVERIFHKLNWRKYELNWHSNVLNLGVSKRD